MSEGVTISITHPKVQQSGLDPLFNVSSGSIRLPRVGIVTPLGFPSWIRSGRTKSRYGSLAEYENFDNQGCQIKPLSYFQGF